MGGNANSGRKLKLTHRVIDELVSDLKKGHYVKAICGKFGFDNSSYYYWRQKGTEDIAEGKDTIYSELVNKVNEATFYSEDYALEKWRSHFDKDWHASAEFLARKFSDRWAKQENRKIEIDARLHVSEEELDKINNASDDKLANMKSKLEDINSMLND
jgi:hypothetical protein